MSTTRIKAFAFALGLLLLAFPVAAQSPNADRSIEVSPPSQEIEASAGETVTAKASIRNKGSVSLPISVRVEDFVAEGEEGQVALKGEEGDSIAKISEISPESFTLEPGQTREVTVSVDLPENAAGGRYGAMVFSVDSDSNDDNAAGISQEVASLFLVRVGGDVNETLALSKFSAPAFSESGPVPFSLTFSNGGNVHIKPYGLINVTDMFGNKVSDVVIAPTNILPGATRVITANLDKRFLIGPYKATAIIYYGTETKDSINAETSFTVIPYKLLAVLALVLFLLYRSRKRVRKALKAMFK